jgi:predicted restriction endonuclease
MSAASSPLPQNPDPGATYQAAFDALGQAYWDASDIDSKDLIHGTQMAIGDILTAINQQQLTTNTALFIQLTPKIKAINTALAEIQTDITKITRNINTTATVVSAVSKVLSLFPTLV